MKHFLRENLATVLFLVALLLIAAFFYARLQTTHDAQIEACHRGNDLRLSLSINEGVQYDFINTARKGRVDAAKAFRQTGDIKQAVINEELARKYTTQLARLRVVAIVNCEKVIK